MTRGWAIYLAAAVASALLLVALALLDPPGTGHRAPPERAAPEIDFSQVNACLWFRYDPSGPLEQQIQAVRFCYLFEGDRQADEGS